MTDRATLAEAFLAENRWDGARRTHLAGDASDRSYQRLWLGGKSAILMNAPPGKGDDPKDFIKIAQHLQSLSLSPPAIIAQDLQHGFLLIEDLGDSLFAKILTTSPEREHALYTLAADVLIHLQRHEPPAGLTNLSAQDWALAANFALEFYAHFATGEKIDSTAFTACLSQSISQYADGPRVLILRDYHAENLLELSGRSGIASVGLLDFQLAQLGQPGYDLISLIQDARRDVSPETAQAMIVHFANKVGLPLDEFKTSCAVLGAQRALRIIGIFARLCVVGGKPNYLQLIPRVWAQLEENLSHPALSELRKICAECLPAPTPDRLERIAKQCAQPCP